MSKRDMVAFWEQTTKNHRHIDRLQLVFADGMYNYDRTDRKDLLAIAKMVFRDDAMAEVRVSTGMFVTFIITSQVSSELGLFNIPERNIERTITEEA